MRLSQFLFVSFALVACFFHAGCERAESGSITAELDEPGYRRGKDLLRQGRNQEALSEFQKVLEKRGLNNSAESHLEMGLLYQQHIKDPIAAIYHYSKFRELKPNSPQAELVRQRIAAATREFARTLPADPLENQLQRLDMGEVVQRLQRENDQLKNELAMARSVSSNRPPMTTTSGPADQPVINTPEPEIVSPIARASLDPEPSAPVNSLAPPSRPTTSPDVSPANNRPATSPATAGGRRHIVAKGDTLFSLAQRYYGNKSRWRDIYAANRNVMKSETDMKIGMELKIP